ncbi:uncharacterized protein DS421_20g703760 [Arachis hypogaea]|nr:uncharacterized protein DS421_20g703760 [Arachis hypogaea]
MQNIKIIEPQKNILSVTQQVCRKWESTALKVNGDVRVALIRIGVVLGKDGEALTKMIPLFKMFAGGLIGSEKQWHVPHLLAIIDWFPAAS